MGSMREEVIRSGKKLAKENREKSETIKSMVKILKEVNDKAKRDGFVNYSNECAILIAQHG